MRSLPKGRTTKLKPGLIRANQVKSNINDFFFYFIDLFIFKRKRAQMGGSAEGDGERENPK